MCSEAVGSGVWGPDTLLPGRATYTAVLVLGAPVAQACCGNAQHHLETNVVPLAMSSLSGLIPSSNYSSATSMLLMSKAASLLTGRLQPRLKSSLAQVLSD